MFGFYIEQWKLIGHERKQFSRLNTYVCQGKKKLFGRQKEEAFLIYAATLGELNAAREVIRTAQKRWPSCCLIILAGREQYINVYEEMYPEAVILRPLPPGQRVLEQLGRLINIRLIIFVEGPGLPGRFPVRMDLALPVYSLRKEIRLIIVNACLYNAPPACRYDTTERFLFGALFSKAVDYWFVADQLFMEDFLRENIPAKKISIVGDVKFDAVFTDTHPLASEKLESILNQVSSDKSPLIIAGSVMDVPEVRAVIAGWLKAREYFPDARLIIAPRYVNEVSEMMKLYQLIEELGLRYTIRSKLVDQQYIENLLVLDSFGELPHFFKICDVAYAGSNHGVIEPMKFGKVVVTGPPELWKQEYSTSYYLYNDMKDKQALISCNTFEEIGEQFVLILTSESLRANIKNRMNKAISGKKGACQRIFDRLEN
ncbi:MAG: hypothetical protein JKY19_00485 [Alcanivoracaceae bacterium]|nr:hypothetical protein [Alcanivoracaceae bacterium]